MRPHLPLPAVTLSLALAACSAAPATPLPDASTPPPAATPALTPTPAVTATPSASASADEPFAILDDKKGDGGDADITEVRMTTDADGLTVLVTLADDVPTNRELGIFFNVASTDGDISRQLGMKWIDGEVTGPFSFDNTTVQQTNYDDESPISVKGRQVASTFPSEAIEGLGDTWQWQAVTSLEGDDQDFAPADGQKSDFPD